MSETEMGNLAAETGHLVYDTRTTRLFNVLCDAVQFLNHLAGFASFDAVG